ncbi:MAG: FAD-binding protein [Desulfobacteraceae bacterium]|nr:FAD-binding protein [Desulfobacteraceae bacterium]
MAETFDLVIIGSGPGGLSSALLAQKSSKSHLILEKGRNIMQGIIYSGPRKLDNVLR